MLRGLPAIDDVADEETGTESMRASSGRNDVGLDMFSCRREAGRDGVGSELVESVRCGVCESIRRTEPARESVGSECKLPATTDGERDMSGGVCKLSWRERSKRLRGGRGATPEAEGDRGIAGGRADVVGGTAVGMTDE